MTFTCSSELMWINLNGTVIQGGMPRVAVDLTEIICRGKSNKRNKQRNMHLSNIDHTTIYMLIFLSHCRVRSFFLISSIESNMNTKYINAIERLLNWYQLDNIVYLRNECLFFCVHGNHMLRCSFLYSRWKREWKSDRGLRRCMFAFR